MIGSLWPRSSSLHYQRRHRLSDRVFLALAKRKIARLSGRRPYYLALVPPSHQGLMRLADGRSYRWFPVLKNGYSSVVRMLVVLYGVGERYSNFAAPLPSEQHGKHDLARLKIRMFGRKEFVRWPRPIMATFLQEQAFCANPRADIRFCILRHPLDRFVSVYRNHMIRPRAKDVRRPYTKLLSPDAFCTRIEEGWHERPWTKGLEAMRDADGYARDRHLWPHHFYLGRDASYFTHIFSLSDLPRVAEFLSDLHKTQVKLPRVNHSGPKPMPHLSASLRRRVEALYKEDFEIFGQHMPPPQV